MSTITERQMMATATDKDQWLTDDAPRGHGRFVGRITPAGERLFYFRYVDASGKRTSMPIGAFDSKGRTGLTLSAARAKAGELSRLYQSGVRDLQGHLEAERIHQETQRLAEQAKLEAEQRAAEAEAARLAARLTVRSLFERWEFSELSNRKDKGAEARRSFEKDVFPSLGDLAAQEVSRPMIVDVLDKVVERGARVVARNLLGDLRQMFGFGIIRGLVEHDPTSHLKRDSFGRKGERDRVLSEVEIRLLCSKLPHARMRDSAVAAIWIMLSTCCRVGEISRARIRDVDLCTAEWHIPPDNSKNGKAHTIYVSDFAIEHFRKMIERAQQLDNEWVFPAQNKDGHVSVKSLAKQIGDRQRGAEAKPLTHRSSQGDALTLTNGKWTPHDLRRTGATLMGELGVRPDVIEKCLNHVESDTLKRIYQRQELREEMREAWRLLGERLNLLARNDAENVHILSRVA